MDPRVSHDWDGLRQLCARLRAPGGCSWDRAQTIRTLTPYLLEETHELLDAIAADENRRIAEEIGDLLYLLVSVLTIAEEEGRFRFSDVAAQTAQKLTRRHPHVFGAAGAPADPATARRGWESIKRLEDEDRPGERPPLASGSERLPALLEAFRVQEKAAGFGFDWKGPSEVLEKLDEERAELSAALGGGGPGTDAAAVREELGDVLFTVVNLARHLGEDPEQALRRTVGKFRTRFARMEALLEAQGQALGRADLAAMEDAWQRAKAAEPSPAAPDEPERRSRSS
jgi:MazG family protein